MTTKSRKYFIFAFIFIALAVISVHFISVAVYGEENRAGVQEESVITQDNSGSQPVQDSDQGGETAENNVSDDSGSVVSAAEAKPPADPTPVSGSPLLINKTGRVYNTANNDGIFKVLLTFADIQTEMEYITYTDDEGYYAIGLPVGVYKVTLQREGFQPIVSQITVTADDENDGSQQQDTKSEEAVNVDSTKEPARGRR